LLKSAPTKDETPRLVEWRTVLLRHAAPRQLPGEWEKARLLRQGYCRRIGPCPRVWALISLHVMNAPNPHDDVQRLSARVAELEALFTHLQRTMGELDQVVLAQQRQIDLLERRLAALGSEVTTISGALADERKPEDEKPPHY